MVTQLDGLPIQPTRVISVFHNCRVRVWTAGETSAVAPLRLALLVAGVVPLGGASVRRLHAGRIREALAARGESVLPLGYTVADPAELLDAEDSVAADTSALLKAVRAMRRQQLGAGRATTAEERRVDELLARLPADV